MSYSIRFTIASPPQDVSADAYPRLLLAIRTRVVDRFGGSMNVTIVRVPPRDDEPARPGFQVTLDFEDSVSPLAVTRALDEVYDFAERIVASIHSSE